MSNQQNTITATIGISHAPLVQGLNQAKAHAKEAAGEFSKLFALEPLGVRRGTHAVERLVEGMTAATDASQGALEAVTNFGRAVSTGFAGGIVIGAVASLAHRFVEAHEEAEALNTSIAKIETTSNKTDSFRTTDEITSGIGEAQKQVDELDLHLMKLGRGQDFSGVGGGIKKFFAGQANDLEAFVHLKTPQGYITDLQEKRAAAAKALTKEIDTQAKKTAEAAAVEQTKFRVGQSEAALMAEGIRFREEQGRLADEEKQTGVVNNAALRVSARNHEEITKELVEQQKAQDRNFATSQRLAGIQRQAVDHQRNAANETERQAAAVRDALDAQTELLSAAEERVDKSKTRGREEQHEAAQQQAQADTGVAKAASGAGQQAGDRLERAAQMNAIGPAGWASVYQQRRAQYLNYKETAKKQGINPDLINEPEMDQIDYDPLSRYRAAVAGEAEQNARAQAEQQKQQRAAQEAAQKQEDYAQGVTKDYADSQGIDLSDPNVDQRFVRQAAFNDQANKAQNAAVDQAQAEDMGEAGGEYRQGGLMWPMSDTRNDGRGATPPFNTSDQPQPSSVPAPPVTSPQDAGIADKIAQAVAKVMRDVWGQ